LALAKRGGQGFGMAVPALTLKPNAKPRVMSGHPWVFANEVVELLAPQHDGQVVECRDRANRFLGTGIYNSRSQIVWRRLSRERVALDAAFLGAALNRAIARRAEGRAGSTTRPAHKSDHRGRAPTIAEFNSGRLVESDLPTASGVPSAGLAKEGGAALPDCCRLVWSESDDLPGLVVDKFGETLVVQIQSLALEQRGALIGDLLAEALKPAEIIFRNDAPIRRLEGLPLGVQTRSGKPWEPRWVTIDGFEYWLDLQSGQKTGFYLDQRAQHPLVAKYCAGKRVLDAFCNQGPFALHAARAGAAEVLGLDSAEDAIAAARRNADRNHVKAGFAVANVFDWFNDPGRAGEGQWDVIVLDPPPFAKSKSALEGALRGYKEINLRALQRLAPGGILATYTCSHHMQDAELRSVLAGAAADAKRKVRILEFCHQPPDHPVLVTMPESEYLRGYVVQAE
jgi:23S rRNA (cytosine1962-C5)-methyltransferase